MTGNAASSGLAVASYEWLAAPALVFVAWWLLPRFLRAGLYTIPEYLEYRYDAATRSLMAAMNSSRCSPFTNLVRSWPMERPLTASRVAATW